MSSAEARKRMKDKKSNKKVESVPLRDNPILKKQAKEMIHVQEEAKLGGNICTKLIFFSLFSALAILITVIIIDYNAYDGENTNVVSNKNWFSWSSSEDGIKKAETEGGFLTGVWNLISTSEPERRVDLIREEYTLKESMRKGRGEKADDSNGNDDDYDEDEIQLEREEKKGDHKIVARKEAESSGKDEEDDDDDDDDDGDENYDEENQCARCEASCDDYERGNGNGGNHEEVCRNEDDMDEEEEQGGDDNDEDDENIGEDNDDDEDGNNDIDEDVGEESPVGVDDGGGDNAEENDGIEDENEEGETAEEQECKSQGFSFTSIITKIIIGSGLLYASYVVLVTKWNNYVIQAEAEIPVSLAVEQSTEPIRDQLLQSVSLEGDENESEYAEENKYSGRKEPRWNAIFPGEMQDSGASSPFSESEEELESDINEIENYPNAIITNSHEWRYRHDLDEADNDWMNDRWDEALEKYRAILKAEGRSTRAMLGIARCLDGKADELKSNRALDEAIAAYRRVISSSHVPEELLKGAAERAIQRIRFKGDYEKALDIHEKLTEKFPQNANYNLELATTFLILNRMKQAKALLETSLKKWPDNGLASAYYGFTLKMEGKLAESVDFLKAAIASGHPGTADSRYFYHLGEALYRLGRQHEAAKVYESGAEKGLFLSKYQRSLYNVEGLKGKPWWSLEETTYLENFKILETNWRVIRNEGLKILKQVVHFQDEAESLREIGSWKQLELYSRGVRRSGCEKAPKTCELLDGFPAATGCRRGQIKFSVMEPDTHVWPHCGPTNCRLRAHLGLIVPSNVSIRVAEETRSWEEGKIFVFDDSFEHEVWHNGTSVRLVLIIDVWHPQLSDRKRKTLPPI